MKKTGELRNCLVCSKKFYAPSWVLKRGNGKCCSIVCVGKNQVGRTPWNKGLSHLPREKHWNWKGGKPLCLDCGKVLSDYGSKRCIKHSHLNQRGKGNGMWKGTEVSYVGLHQWIKRTLGKPLACRNCGTKTARKIEWANINHKYRRDLVDWVSLCTSCHRKYDNSRT